MTFHQSIFSSRRIATVVVEFAVRPTAGCSHPDGTLIEQGEPGSTCASVRSPAAAPVRIPAQH